MTEGKRLEKQIDLDATVDEVWEAVATGPGLSTWFVPHSIQTDAAGLPLATEGDFGSGNTDSGRLHAWEPKHRVSFLGEGDKAEALEFIVEGQDGGSTVLRLIQSGVQGEDWEMEYHSQGWDVFFHNLQSYFGHFRGLPVANALAMSFTAADRTTVWDRYHAALGTDRSLSVGDQVDLRPEGVEAITGTVDLYQTDALLGIRTSSGLYRFGGEGANAWGMVNLFHYQYGSDVESGKWTDDWQRWMNTLFPPEQAPA